MTSLSLSNLVIYSAQILLVVAAATIGGHILRLSAPRPRFAFWRAVVAACLLLPLWPKRIDVATTAATIGGAETVASRSDVTVVSPTAWISLIPWVLLSGAAARGAWLAFGFLRLRRLRARSVSAMLDGEIEALRRALAPDAELRWDDHVDRPLTFGFWRPIVLLPRRLNDLSPDAQRAVVTIGRGHSLKRACRRPSGSIRRCGGRSVKCN